jgi:hypothetical protein
MTIPAGTEPPILPRRGPSDLDNDLDGSWVSVPPTARLADPAGLLLLLLVGPVGGVGVLVEAGVGDAALVPAAIAFVLAAAGIAAAADDLRLPDRVRLALAPVVLAGGSDLAAGLGPVLVRVAAGGVGFRARSLDAAVAPVAPPARDAVVLDMLRLMLVTRPKVGRAAPLLLPSAAGCAPLGLGVVPAVVVEVAALVVGATAVPAAAVMEVAVAEGLDLKEVLLIREAAPLRRGPASRIDSKFM